MMPERRKLLSILIGALPASLIGSSRLAVAATAAPAPSDGSSVDVREAMLGSWRVVVEGEKRARLLIVDAVEGAANGALRISGGYGFEDSAPTRIAPATLAREGDAAVLRLVTGAKSIVIGRWTEPGRFDGTIEYPQTEGRARSVKPVTITKLDADVDDAPAIRTRARPGAIMVLYVGAWNCPSCLAWKKRRIDDGERALLARVTLREVDTPSYADLTYDPAWPEDLKAIRDRYKIRRGTPRYYVFAGGKLVKKAFGALAWARDILPVVQHMLDGTPG
jgi:hypothetical protein